MAKEFDKKIDELKKYYIDTTKRYNELKADIDTSKDFKELGTKLFDNASSRRKLLQSTLSNQFYYDFLKLNIISLNDDQILKDTSLLTYAKNKSSD